MAQMSKMQNKFAKDHAGELEGIEADLTPTPGSAQPGEGDGFFPPDKTSSAEGGKPVAIGAKRSQSVNLDSTR
jgi:hypothetical protein